MRALGSTWAAIAALFTLAAAPAQDKPRNFEFQALADEYQKAAAAQGADQAEVTKSFLTRFQAAAKQHAGKDAAVPFLTWIVEHGGDQETVTAALTAISSDHVTSPDLAPLAERLAYLEPTAGEERVGALLDRLIEKSGHPEVQARALYARSRIVLGRFGDKVDDAEHSAAIEDLQKAKKLTKNGALVAAIDAINTERRGLGIGEPAPDIAGTDLDGTPFRLSDYRGKVVVLDFWGDW